MQAIIAPILDCIPPWMKRYFDLYDPNADPLDLSTASTRPGRRSSMFDPRFSDYNPIQPPIPQWQAEADDPLNLSRHSTLPGRRSSMHDPLPAFLSPARRRSSALEPGGEAEGSPARRRSSVPMMPALVEDAAPAGDGARNDRAIQPSQPAESTQQRYWETDWQEDRIGHAKTYTRATAGTRQAVARREEAGQATEQNTHHDSNEVKRSWPDPPGKGERQIVAANYSAVEIHGFFGLIDDGSDGAGRMLIVHVPKWIRGYFLDIKQGDTLHVYHAKGKKVGGALTVLSTGRHKYYAPGRRVTTCTVCVPEEQWAPFA